MADVYANEVDSDVHRLVDKVIAWALETCLLTWFVGRYPSSLMPTYLDIQYWHVSHAHFCTSFVLIGLPWGLSFVSS